MTTRAGGLLLALALAAAPAGAATASLVADVSASTPPFHLYDFEQRQLTPVGKRIVFEGFDPSIRYGLWGSDGTDAGTALLAVCTLCSDQGIRVLGTVGGIAYFTLAGSVTELWRTDGTREGTFNLVMGLGLDPAFGLGTKKLFFTLCPPEGPCELWASDGTVAGTVAVERHLPDLTFGAPHDLTPVGDRMYFMANGEDGYELWVSDGTPAGTHRGRVVSAYPAPSVFAAVGGHLLFLSSDSAGTKLWASVGATGDAALIAQLPPGLATSSPAVSAATVAGGSLRFLAQNPAGGYDLWTSDGTAGGTRRLTDFGAAQRFPFALGPWQISAIGGRLLFFTLGLDGNLELWASAGTPGTTGPLSGCPGGCPRFTESAPGRRLPSFVAAGGRVLFVAVDGTGSRLWASDGTGAGTHVVRTLCTGGCDDEASLTGALGQALFFTQVAGRSTLFATDGTAAGTRRLATIGPTGSPSGFEAAGAGGKIFFSAIADAAQGPQLWASDGTAQGTGEVTLLGADGPSSRPVSLVSFAGGLLWSADDGGGPAVWTTGGGAPSRLTPAGVQPISPLVVAGAFAFFAAGETFEPQDLWRTDGTAAGTVRIAALAGPLRSLTAFAGRLFFVTSSGGVPTVWASDGTSAGTAPAFVLPASVDDVSGLAAAGGRLFLTVADSAGTSPLWVSDGTGAGTHPLTPVADFLVDAAPQLTALGPTTFFAASVSNSTTELWKTDGTAAGTTVVLPAAPDGYGANPTDLVTFGGALYFFAGGERFSLRRGLWRSDGTTAGTVVLKLFAGTGENAVVGGQLFFVADDGVHGRELWKTDGTAAGTVLVRDIAPGAPSSHPVELVAAGGLLYFTADDGVHGAELWQSDGTAAGTRLVEDLAPGPLSSTPASPVASGGQLYFTADDGLFGRELWAYPLAADAPGCTLSDTVLCLGGGRFRVEAHWSDLKGGGGPGHAAAISGDTGTFWFFSPSNVETIVKVLDGRGLNGHFWVFYGALSNVEYTITVTDTATGAVRRYLNPPGHLGSVGDTEAFGPHGATGSAPASLAAVAGGETSPLAVAVSRAAPAPCLAGPGRLCLNGGRFAVEAQWKDFQGRTGTGNAVPLTGDTGTFWFFAPSNVEVVLKVLDGRAVNGKFWVFYGALSNVEYTLRVTDTATGAIRTYTNPSGHFGSVADTGAF